MKSFLLAAALLSVAVPATAATNLITNGNFETGNIAGWALADSGSGSWYVIGNGAGTALNGFATPTLAGGGSYVAMTDQGRPGSHNLSQTLTLSGGKFVLSFDARGSDQSGSGGAPDQQYIVTVDGVTIAGPIITPAWGTYSFNLNLAAGAHTFAFQENDDRLYYAAGLDNVSLVGGVPEASTWALMIAGFGLVGVSLRRRTAVAA
jgi:hypothetical protein